MDEEDAPVSRNHFYESKLCEIAKTLQIGSNGKKDNAMNLRLPAWKKCQICKARFSTVFAAGVLAVNLSSEMEKCEIK
jgi:hypothetical protein